MATPKHILRIHDTEANLFANLKDTQIAFATDTNRIIWREGSSFWTFDAGLKWNGTNFEGNEVSTGVIKVYQFNGTEALQIGDGGGNPNLLTTGILTLNADQLKLTLANTTGSASKLLAVTGAGKVVEIDVIAPTMQETYDNSSDPEILTDATRGALTLKRGSTLDSDNVLEVLNGAGTSTWAVSGDGVASFKTTTNGSPATGDVWSDGTRTNIQGNLGINGTNQGIQGNRGDDDYLYITNRSSVNDGANIKLIDSSVDGEYGNLRIYTTDVLDWYQNYIKSYVPIRFDSSILNPSPINGEIWYDGVNLVGREGSVTGKIAYKNVDNNFSADQTFQGNANIGDVLNLASTTNGSPTNGDIWYDGTNVQIEESLRINSNTAAISLVGTNHNYISYYPTGISTRSGYVGFADSVSLDFYIKNETSGKDIKLITTSGKVEIQGQVKISDDLYFSKVAGEIVGNDVLISRVDQTAGYNEFNGGTNTTNGFSIRAHGSTRATASQQSKGFVYGAFQLQSFTNSSPSTGDIWLDSTSGDVTIQGDIEVNNSVYLNDGWLYNRGTTETGLSSGATTAGGTNIILLESGTIRFRTGTTNQMTIDSDKVKVYDVLNLNPISADPSSPSDGDIWYNSTSGTFKCRANGVTETIAFV